MCKGDISQMEVLEKVDEVKFYHILKDHEKRAEFEAKYPRTSFF